MTGQTEGCQPDELDEAFIQEYFKLVKDDLNLDDEGAEVSPLGPLHADAKLSKQRWGTIVKINFIIRDTVLYIG